MDDLTLDEAMDNASMHAREIAAEIHFFDAAQPFFPLGFSVSYRNPGHWDVYASEPHGRASAWRAVYPDCITSMRDGARCRVFRIRGEPGQVVIYDERWNPHREQGGEPLTFRSVTGAMLWIVEEMMQEPPARA